MTKAKRRILEKDKNFAKKSDSDIIDKKSRNRDLVSKHVSLVISKRKI